MKNEEFGELLKQLHLAYPTKTLPASTVNLWFGLLRECDFKLVKRRMEEHISQHTYIPSVSQLYVMPETETNVLDILGEWEKEGVERVEHIERWGGSKKPWQR
jgi:Loader and inhibitor of phage G40P